MDRLFPDRVQRSAAHGRRWALILCAVSVTACVAQQPLVVEPTLASKPAIAAKADAAGACRVVVSQISDRRRVSDTLGIVAGRAVKSPGDVDGWLRSILEKLGTRDIQVAFGDAAGPEKEIAVAFSLQSVWLSDIKTSKAANVVAHVRAERAGVQLIDRDYRGTVTRINWASTDTELQQLTDDAFGKVLDEMAADLRRACAA